MCQGLLGSAKRQDEVPTSSSFTGFELIQVVPAAGSVEFTQERLGRCLLYEFSIHVYNLF